MTFVRPGAVVKDVYWETIPDKYQPPKKFTDRMEAFDYAERNALWLELVVTFPEGEVRLGAERDDWVEHTVEPGDVVRRAEYRVQQWPDHEGPVAFPEPDAAIAAAPDGRLSAIYQTLWVGPHEIRLLGTAGAVDKSQKES